MEKPGMSEQQKEIAAGIEEEVKKGKQDQELEANPGAQSLNAEDFEQPEEEQRTGTDG